MKLSNKPKEIMNMQKEIKISFCKCLLNYKTIRIKSGALLLILIKKTLVNKFLFKKLYKRNMLYFFLFQNDFHIYIERGLV